MKSRLIKYFLVTIIIITAIISGCSSDDSKAKYLKSAKQFNKIYFETVECIDLKNTMKSLEALQTEVNDRNIEELGALLFEIKNNIPKEKEPHYLDFKKRYQDLVFLVESYSNFGSLNHDERGKIDMIFISISANKDDWKDKESTTIWE